VHSYNRALSRGKNDSQSVTDAIRDIEENDINKKTELSQIRKDDRAMRHALYMVR